MYENDEDIASEEEVEFENTAVNLQQQFKKLSAKFQQILLQESTLSHRTSETCQVQQLMIDDLKNEMKELQQQLDEAEDCEKLLKKDIKPETVDLTDEDDNIDSVDNIKNSTEIKDEVKNEFVKSENSNSETEIFQQQQLRKNVDDIKQEHQQSKLQQQYNADIKHCVKSSTVKEDFEDFDIESEITPSFIMKRSSSNSPTITTTPPLPLTTASPSPKRSFNDVYLETTQQLHQQDSVAKQQPQTPQTFNKQEETERLSPQSPTLSESVSSLQIPSTTMQPCLQQQQQSQFVNQQQQQQEHFVQQLQQEDEWLCIQNELNMMNHKENKTTNNDAYTSRSNTNMNDLFPNGCLRNVDNKHETDTQDHQANEIVDNIGEFFDSTDDDEVQRSVETRLDAMFGESPVPLGGKNDSDTQDIENNLDEIFGNTKSPVGETGVSIIDAIKNKRLWENEMATANNFVAHPQQQSSEAQKNFYNNENSAMPQQYATQHQQQQQQQQPHQIQLNCNNNPRWMQNMEAQFSDFNSSLALNGGIVADEVNGSTTTRKRHWNEQQDDLLTNNKFVGNDLQPTISKKLCNGNTNLSASSTISSTSSSPLSQQHVVMAHQHDMLNADLLLHDVAEFAQQQQHQHQAPHFNAQQQQPTYADMMIHNVDMHAIQQQQQTQHHQQQRQQQPHENGNQHFVNNNHNIQQQLQQNQHNHQDQQVMNTNNNVEFDDDISRHVQNAIDSILNLQNSESDSLPFPLDHSMGSLLGDSILDDRQHSATTTTNVVPTISNCQPTTDEMNTNLLIGDNCGDELMNKRRMNLVDELGDCLISGVSQCGDNASNILLNQHQYQSQQQSMPHNMLNHQSQQQQQYHQAQTSTSQLSQEMLHHHHQHHHHHHDQQPQQATTTTTSTTPEVLNDFSCMVANIDEAVKSMMGS